MRSTKKTNPFRIFIWLILILILFLILGFFYYQYLISPLNSDDKYTELFSITSGESTSEIAQNLEDQGLIRSALAFKILLKLSNQAGKIQAGDFKLSPSMDSSEIINQLEFGIVDKQITLLEGWRVEEMAQKLNQVFGVNPGDFTKGAKEGYMFPDTYKFNKDEAVSDIILTMENNFNQKYDDNLKSQIPKQGLTESQGVILASIVEREARSEGNRAMVASILLKRFQIGMALDTDATIQYALGYQKGEDSWWKKKLSSDDLNIDSSYNTYTHTGLPPTPICSPSLASLQAVAQADPNTPYLYYYDDSQGVAHYAKTLDEHNQNIQNYP